MNASGEMCMGRLAEADLQPPSLVGLLNSD